MTAKECCLSWGMLILSVLFNVVGVFVVKAKLNTLGPVEFNSVSGAFSYFLLAARSKLVIGGVVLFLLAPFFFAIALSRMDITIAYPVQVLLNFIILVILAALFLGEGVTMTKAIGIALALISIFFFYK